MERSGAPNLALIDTMRLRTAWGPAGRAEPHFLDEKKLLLNLVTQFLPGALLRLPMTGRD